MTSSLGPLPPLPSALAAALAATPTVPQACTGGAPGATVPDFATMFAAPAHHGPVIDNECATGADGDCPACLHPLTPRMAYLLAFGAYSAVDMWIDDARLDDGSGSYCGPDIPPVAERYGSQTPGWFEQLAAAIRDIGLQVEAGQVPHPNSTAQEMALHIALEYAGHALEVYWDDPDADSWASLNRLPVHATSGEHDDDLDGALHDGLKVLTDVLFEDHDVLMLFDQALDGIESDPEIAARMGMVNLHPKDWFIPFRDETASALEEAAAPTPALEEATAPAPAPAHRGRGGKAHDVLDALERHGYVVATLDSPERAKKFRTVMKSVAGRRSVRYRSSTVRTNGQVQLCFRDPERSASAGSDEPTWEVHLGGLSDEVLFGSWVW